MYDFKVKLCDCEMSPEIVSLMTKSRELKVCNCFDQVGERFRFKRLFAVQMGVSLTIWLRAGILLNTIQGVQNTFFYLQN